MSIRRVSLVNQSSQDIPFAELSRVAAALQIQIDRDFGAIWGVRAHIVAIAVGQEPLPGSWPLNLVDKARAGLGVHLDPHHHPFAEITVDKDWSVTASHELLEMLADPYGHRFAASPDIDPDSDGHIVHYLVEVGDPCEVFAYSINGVAVSDFVVPDYYVVPAGGPVDFLQALQGPLDVPDGCYISWIDPADQRWHQKTPDGQFVTARAKANPKGNPRQDRDDAFGADPERHDLSTIRARAAARRARSLT